MTTIVKAYFERSGEDTEIRRFDFDQVKVGIYNSLACHVTQVFRDLQGKSFTLSWKDDDNDKITFSSDQELTEALSFANNGVLQVYIKIHDDRYDQTSVIHPGVICNGCNVALHGTRYKCLVCPNYDLCMTCEEKGLHKEHNMMVLRTPSSNGMKLFPLHLHHLARPYPSCRANGRRGPLRRPHGPHIQQRENDRHDGCQGNWRQMRQVRRHWRRQMMGRTNKGNHKETKQNQNETIEQKTDTETTEHNVSQSNQCAMTVDETGGTMSELLNKLHLSGCHRDPHGRHGSHAIYEPHACDTYGVPDNVRYMRRSWRRWLRQIAVQNNEGGNDRHGDQGHWRQMRQARRRCWRQMMGRSNEGNQKETKPNQNKTENKTNTETTEHNVSQSEQCAMIVGASAGYMPEPRQKCQRSGRRYNHHGTCGSHGFPGNLRQMRRSSWRWWRQHAVQRQNVVQNNDSNQREAKPNKTDTTINNTDTEAKTSNGSQSEEHAKNVDNYMLDHLDIGVDGDVENKHYRKPPRCHQGQWSPRGCVRLYKGVHCGRRRGKCSSAECSWEGRRQPGIGQQNKQDQRKSRLQRPKYAVAIMDGSVDPSTTQTNTAMIGGSPISSGINAENLF